MCSILLVFLLVAPVAAMGAGTPATSGLKGAEWAVTVSFADGDALVLGDGRQVRLVGTQAHKLSLGRRNFKAWPLVRSSKKAPERLSLRKRLKLSYGGALAHPNDGPGVWIQSALLSEGMARKRDARRNRRGIWSNKLYAVHTPKSVRHDIAAFKWPKDTSPKRRGCAK